MLIIDVSMEEWRGFLGLVVHRHYQSIVLLSCSTVLSDIVINRHCFVFHHLSMNMQAGVSICTAHVVYVEDRFNLPFF